MIPVDKGVPIPDGNRKKYPWTDMEVGDSFLIPGARHGAAGSMIASRKKHVGHQYVCRMEDAGLRVWRVK